MLLFFYLQSYVLGKNDVTFRILYDVFHPGWEIKDENLVMMEIGLTYRAWEDEETIQPKGWVAKTNSKVLKEKRKQITWVRRRQPQEVTTDGKKTAPKT